MQNKSKLNDYIKGISITAIVLYHLIAFYIDVPNIVKIVSSFGGSGVHMFFICSGFGLAFSYMNRPMSMRDFLRKRFFKIYIPYIVVVIISFFVPIMYVEGDRIWALLSHVFLFKMFIPQYETSFGGHWWYISTLFQFYIIFVPLMQLRKKINGRISLFLVL